MLLLPTQGHFARPGWDGILDETPRARSHTPRYKPPAAFWTSSIRADGATAFYDFLVENELRIPADFFAFEVVGQPAVLVLREDADLATAVRRVGLDPGADMDEAFIDASFRRGFWTSIAGLYDAVHVPADFDTYAVFSGWDCESTAWLRPARFLRLTHRGPSAARVVIPVRATQRRL